MFVEEELVDEERDFVYIFITFGKKFLGELLDSEHENILAFFQEMFKITFLENSASE